MAHGVSHGEGSAERTQAPAGAPEAQGAPFAATTIDESCGAPRWIDPERRASITPAGIPARDCAIRAPGFRQGLFSNAAAAP
jgi:hypothetical protein